MRLLHAALPRLALSIITLLSLLVHDAHASLRARDIISHVSPISSPVIHTPSHRVNAFSIFDLTFTIPDPNERRTKPDQAGTTGQRIRLALEPNHDILAHDSAINYVDAAGRPLRSELIARDQHRIYKGEAYIASNGANGDHLGWEHVGWTRLVVRVDGRKPLFEGSFSVLGDHHHVMLGGKYLRSKGPHDPLPAIPEGVLDDDEYMVVFRDSDMIAPEQQLDRRDESVAVPGRLCNSQQLDFNSNPNHPIYRHLDSSNSLLPHHLGGFSGMLHRRDDGLGEGLGSTNYSNTIGSTAGCPKTRKVALVGIALDCSYTASFNSTETARDNVISVVNAASHVYEKSFNITLGLRNLTVFPPDCPGQAPSTAAFNIGCDTDAGKKTDISGRLNLFSAWRGQQNDDNAYWTLMSDCSSGSEVGLSWLGQLCVTNAHGGSSDSSDGDGDGASKSDATKSSVSGANVVIKTSVEWQVFAHETGHTFGAIHDCDTSTCARGHAQKLQCCPATGQTCDARGRYIMNPSANADAVEFSPCTIGNVCSGMLHHAIKTDCLTSNRGIQTITHAQCGNGVVEDGEDCDCGGEEQCAGNRCCDPKTCKFKDNAVCDDSNEECCKDCQFASASTVCRPSTGPCDPEEKCTGDSPVCPKDEHSPDGEKCSGNGTITEGSGFVGTLRCASGQCTSRDQQCRLVMGSMLDGDQTTACDTSTCRITCTGPSQPSMFCAAVMQNYLDGTPCRGSGHCKNGRCQGATFGGEVKSWVSQHKNLVIGLAAGIGGFLVLAVITGIIKRCRSPPRPRNAQPMPPQQMSPMPMQMPMPPPPPPAQPPHGYSGSPSMAQHVPWQPGPPPGPPGAMPQQPQPMYYPPPSNPPPPRYA